MKKSTILFICMLLQTFYLTAQVAVNADASQPDPSAMLDVKSVSHGVLIPRMTELQIAAIQYPADGLIAYNTDNGKIYVFVVSSNLWKVLSFGTDTISPGFTCGNSYTDARDSKTYNTILIGTQCWMKENLNYGVRIDGNMNQTDNGIAEKYCYLNDELNCDVYGGLYQWAEMVQYLNGASNTGSWIPVPTGNIQGICPAGWHIPSDDEWTLLSNFLGGEPVAGGPMKETGFDHWVNPNIGATNTSGFTTLPGGDRHSDSNFYNMYWMAWFWTSTEAFPAVGWYRSLDAMWANLNRSLFDKANGFSLRCVHD